MLLLHSPNIRKSNMDMILFLYFMLDVCTLCNFWSQKGHLEFSFFILESVNFNLVNLLSALWWSVYPSKQVLSLMFPLSKDLGCQQLNKCFMMVTFLCRHAGTCTTVHMVKLALWISLTGRVIRTYPSRSKVIQCSYCKPIKWLCVSFFTRREPWIYPRELILLLSICSTLKVTQENIGEDFVGIICFPRKFTFKLSH